WQFAYYHAWLENEFVNYRFADGDTDTINAHRTKKDGIELGLNGDIKQNIWANDDAFEMRAAYTFNYFTLDHDPLYGNNILPGVPKHYLRTEILYKHPSGFNLGPNVEWTPTRAPVDLTNTFYASSYTIYGFRSFWENQDHQHNFYLEVRNLFNKN